MGRTAHHPIPRASRLSGSRWLSAATELAFGHEAKELLHFHSHFHFSKERSMTDPKRKIQGEGDKESDRKYREQTEQFVKSERGQEEIENAGNLSEEEARRLRKAEDQAKSRAKDEDPQIRHQTNR
jgi:hypothetical protein